MPITSFRHIFIIFQLYLQLHILLLSRSKLLSQLMYFFKQFLQALLIFPIILVYFNLNFLITALSISFQSTNCLQINFFIIYRNINGFKWLYLFFTYHCCLILSLCQRISSFLFL